MKKVFALMFLVFFLVGCMETVPPAHKGKRLTPSGYEPDVLEPGRHSCWWRCTMVLLETTTQTYKERVPVIMSDKLTLFAEIRFRGRIAGSPNIINSMFNDVKAGDDDIVSFDEIYKIYGRPAVRNKVREVISDYEMDNVHKNYVRISKQIAEALKEPISRTPLEISEIALGNIQYPELVTKAINQAQERRLGIEKEKAQAEIELTKKENERRLAEADYQIKITKAKAIRDQNKIIADGVTPELLEFRRLDILENATKNANGNATFIPLEALTSPGFQMRMYGK